MSSVALELIAETQRRNLTKEYRPTSPRTQITDKIGKCAIPHESMFKVAWDWLVLALVMFTAIYIPYEAAFLVNTKESVWQEISSGEPQEIVNLMVDLMFIIDILINFRTTYVEKKSEVVVSSPKKIAIHYLKSWFIVDFIAAIPFDYFIPDEANGAASLTGLLKTARLLRLIRVSRKMDRYSEYGIAVIFLLTAIFTLIAHWLACIWHVIGQKEIEVPYGWIQLLAGVVEQPINQSEPGSGPGSGTRYITALYFTLTSLTSIGFGNVAPNTDNEKIFSVMTMLIGALFYAAIFGNLTAIIQRLYSRTARYHRDLRVVKEFIALHNIPEYLQGTLREYFAQEQTAAKGDDIESIMYRFPESLQADIRVHLNHSLFEQFEIFQGASQGSLRALATAFHIELFPHKHFLLKEGDQVTKLYFIVTGTVDIIKGDQSIVSLGPGDVVGCNMTSRRSKPGNHCKSRVSLLSKVSSNVHIIAWQDLLRVMRVYPEVRTRIMEDMVLRFELDSDDTEDHVVRQEDQQSYIDILQTVTEEDSLLVTAPRRPRGNTNENLPSDQKNASFSTDVHLEKMEERLAQVEGLLGKILETLKNTNSGLVLKRTQSTNDSEIANSVV